MSVVDRAVRGMKRKRPTPDRGDRSKRNDRVLRLAEQGLTRAEIGAKVGLSFHESLFKIRPTRRDAREEQKGHDQAARARDFFPLFNHSVEGGNEKKNLPAGIR